MGQTPLGAKKSSAIKLGITLDEYLAKIDAGFKRCSKCKAWKPIAAFNRDKSRNDGIKTSCQGCDRVKVHKDLKGRPSAFKGRSHSVESRANMAAARVGNQNKKGKILTEEQKQFISKRTREFMPKGADCWWSWKGGVNPENMAARRSSAYLDWRVAVFKRDHFTCQDCGDSRGGNLEAHHLKSFADFPDLRFDVNNGVTLCENCHEKRHMKANPTKDDLRRRRKYRT